MQQIRVVSALNFAKRISLETEKLLEKRLTINDRQTLAKPKGKESLQSSFTELLDEPNLNRLARMI